MQQTHTLPKWLAVWLPLALGVAYLVVQWLSYVNPDSAWLLVVAQRMLGGEALYTQIGETNPPLVVWLHLIPVWLAQVYDVSLPHAFILCVGVLSWISYAACVQVNRAWPLLNLVYLVILLATSINHFGQREHLLFLLAAPYLFSLLPGNQPNLLAAVIATVGFALKPYFLLLWLVSVAFAGCRGMKSYGAVVGLLGVYVLYVFKGDTVYVQQVLPVLLDYYHGLDAPPFLEKLAVFAVLALLPYGVAWHKPIDDERWPLLHVLAGWVLASLIMVWLQHKDWANHWYPFYLTAGLLNAVIIWVLLSHQRTFEHKLSWALATLTIGLLVFISGAASRDMLEHRWPNPNMVKQIEQVSGARSYVFSTDIEAAFPSVLHGEGRIVSKYHHLWFLPGMYQTQVEAPYAQVSYRPPETMDSVEKRLFDGVVSDFLRNVPELVIVTKRSDYYHPTHNAYGFDFIRYYSQDARFAKAWRHYKAVGRVGTETYYRKR